ncbi:hypothetical protein PCC9214_04867 [Planktothrix tepida]|nr:hypothetical protein PCC9214_04867 [Planktothrix tepida]
MVVLQNYVARAATNRPLQLALTVVSAFYNFPEVEDFGGNPAPTTDYAPRLTAVSTCLNSCSKRCFNLSGIGRLG